MNQWLLWFSCLLSLKKIRAFYSKKESLIIIINQHRMVTSINDSFNFCYQFNLLLLVDLTRSNLYSDRTKPFLTFPLSSLSLPIWNFLHLPFPPANVSVIFSPLPLPSHPLLALSRTLISPMRSWWSITLASASWRETSWRLFPSPGPANGKNVCPHTLRSATWASMASRCPAQTGWVSEMIILTVLMCL